MLNSETIILMRTVVQDWAEEAKDETFKQRCLEAVKDLEKGIAGGTYSLREVKV